MLFNLQIDLWNDAPWYWCVCSHGCLIFLSAMYHVPLEQSYLNQTRLLLMPHQGSLLTSLGFFPPHYGQLVTIGIELYQDKSWYIYFIFYWSSCVLHWVWTIQGFLLPLFLCFHPLYRWCYLPMHGTPSSFLVWFRCSSHWGSHVKGGTVTHHVKLIWALTL